MTPWTGYSPSSRTYGRNGGHNERAKNHVMNVKAPGQQPSTEEILNALAVVYKWQLPQDKKPLEKCDLVDWPEELLEQIQKVITAAENKL